MAKQLSVLKGKRKSRPRQEIPTSSLADMAFLLLIFFMTTTVFRAETPLPIEKPDAEATEKVEERKKDILHLWMNPAGEVFINDQNVAIENVAAAVQTILNRQPRLVVAIRADQSLRFGILNDVLDQLKIAGAVRVNFATDLEEVAF